MFVRKKRAPARKAKGKAKGRKAAKRKAGLRLPSLEQRHLDLIGLLLVAFGVYLVFVLFFGWEGGKVGSGVETALTYLFGEVGARIFTVALLAAGAMLLTGTSVSALAHGIGRGVRTLFRGSGEAARTAARNHADWRQDRHERRTRALEA